MCVSVDVRGCVYAVCVGVHEYDCMSVGVCGCVYAMCVGCVCVCSCVCAGISFKI